MNILLLNAHSPQNAGDLAILEETLGCLQHAFPGATITVAINDLDDELLPSEADYVPSLTRWLVDLRSDGTWRWHKALFLPLGLWLLLAALLFRVFRLKLLPPGNSRAQLMARYYAADCVAVIGGGHLYAPHALNIAFLWLWVGLAAAVVMGKPLVLLPQSFGPLPGRFQRALLRWLLQHSTLVAAREYQSLRLLADIGVRRRVLVLPDLAFGTQAASPVQVERLLPALSAAKRDERPLVGVTLMDWGGQNARFGQQAQYEEAMIGLIKHLVERYNARVALFAQCTGPTPNQDDRRIAARIAAALPAYDLIRADLALSPAVLKAAYAQLDALVATRMHSAIFALGARVPTLAIGYLHKSIGIMTMLGLGAYTLDIAEADTVRVCSLFDRLWAEQSLVRAQLGRRLPAVETTLAYLPALVREAVSEANT